MKDKDKREKQLVEELEALRKEVTKLRRTETKRKRVEEALYKTVKQWETTLDMVTDSICLLDEKLIIQRLNKAMPNLLKKDPNEIIGHHCWEIVHGISEPIPECPILRMKKTLHRESMELLMGERWFDISVDPILDGSGSLIGAVHIIRDITERRQTEEMLRESEERFRMVLESSMDNLYRRNLKTDNYDYMSPAVAPISGYSPEEMLSMPIESVLSMIHPDDIDRVKRAVGESMTSDKTSYLIEYRFRHKDGQYRWLSDLFTIVKDAKGRPLYLVGNVRDITERKHSEEALKRKSEEQALLLDNIETRIWYLADPETYRAVNKAHAEFFAKEKEELENKNLHDIYRKEEAEVCIAGNREVFKKKTRLHTEEWVTNGKGEKRLVSVTKSPKLDENGNVEYVVCAAEDITERKRAEEGLQKSEEKYRTLYESSKDGIIFTDMGGNILDVNQAYLDMVRYSKEEIIKLTYQQLTPAKWHEMEAEIVKNQITARDYSEEYEKEYIRKDGTVFPITLRVWLIKDEKGEPKGMWGIVREITERKKAEEAIRKSQQLLERTFSSLRDSVFIIDADTVEIKDCNSAASETFGYSRQEMLGQTTTFLHVDEMALEEFRKYLYAAIEEKGFLDHLEFRMKRKDGEIFPTEHTVTPIEDEQGRRIGWVSVVRDITERRQAEEELRESEERYRVLFESSPYPVTLMDLLRGAENVLHLTRHTGLSGAGSKPLPFGVGAGYSTSNSSRFPPSPSCCVDASVPLRCS